MLKECNNFLNEQTELPYMLALLGILAWLTPKCHPEISGHGVEYTWGYGKFQFRCKYNNVVAKHLNQNVLNSLDHKVITVNRIRKISRKAREYKLTYALIVNLENGEDAAAGKEDI